MADSQAMLRWVLPILQEWPSAVWHVWLADATNCNDIKAAKVATDGDGLEWQPVDHENTNSENAVCQIIGGRSGLVILAHHSVATVAARGLDGLVARMVSFPANDPLAKPLTKSFASFGVYAGI